MKSNGEGEGSSVRENEPKNEEKKMNEDANCDRNKFKKVEMPIFNGDDLDSWLFWPKGTFKSISLLTSKK